MNFVFFFVLMENKTVECIKLNNKYNLNKIKLDIFSKAYVTNYSFSCFNSVPVLNWAPTS